MFALKDVSCGPAPSSRNATFKYFGEGLHRIALYCCDSGFYFTSGKKSLICTGGGTWAGNLISCSRM